MHQQLEDFAWQCNMSSGLSWYVSHVSAYLNASCLLAKSMLGPLHKIL